MRIINNVMELISIIVFKLFKIKEDYIYFYNIWGKYNDNVRYVYEYMKENYPMFTYIWELEDVENEKLLSENVIVVKKGGIKATYYKSVSRLIFDNGIGYMSKCQNMTPVKRKIFRLYKRVGQENISMWHGTPIKKIFNDISFKENYKDCFTTSTNIIVGDYHTKEILSKSTFGQVKVFTIGSPRNDLLFSKSIDLKSEIKKTLGIPEGKKIILYAPTFRTDYDNNTNILRSGCNQLEQMMPELLFEKLSKCFGGDWILVLRLHPSISKNVNLNRYIEKFGKNIYDGNKDFDMAEYLLISDILITDYSSSVFDFILTEKPCFLFCPDVDNYRNNERGFYFDIEHMGFPFAESFNDLIFNFENFNYNSYKESINELKGKLGICDNGKASEIISKIALENSKELLKGRVTNETS